MMLNFVFFLHALRLRFGCPSIRTFAPAGLLALLALIVLPPTVLAQTDPELREEALDLVNEDRRAQGLEPLESDARLNAAAESHAEDMLRRGYFSHRSPEGTSVMDRFRAEGGSESLVVAENIGRCSGCSPTLAQMRDLQEGWMNSPGHRANILSAGFRQFGFGLASDGAGNLYAVQTFAGPGAPRARQGDEPPKRISNAEAAELALSELNRARESEGLEPLELSRALSEAAREMLSEATESGALSLQNISMRGALDRLPAAERRNLRSLSTVAGECGGCGEFATNADVEYFIDEWLSNSSYRQRLLDRSARTFGFGLAADGTGRKVAIAFIASR